MQTKALQPSIRDLERVRLSSNQLWYAPEETKAPSRCFPPSCKTERKRRAQTCTFQHSLTQFWEEGTQLQNFCYLARTTFGHTTNIQNHGKCLPATTPAAAQKTNPTDVSPEVSWASSRRSLLVCTRGNARKKSSFNWQFRGLLLPEVGNGGKNISPHRTSPALRVTPFRHSALAPVLRPIGASIEPRCCSARAPRTWRPPTSQMRMASRQCRLRR